MDEIVTEVHICLNNFERSPDFYVLFQEFWTVSFEFSPKLVYQRECQKIILTQPLPTRFPTGLLGVAVYATYVRIISRYGDGLDWAATLTIMTSVFLLILGALQLTIVLTQRKKPSHDRCMSLPLALNLSSPSTQSLPSQPPRGHHSYQPSANHNTRNGRAGSATNGTPAVIKHIDQTKAGVKVTCYKNPLLEPDHHQPHEVHDSRLWIHVLQSA